MITDGGPLCQAPGQLLTEVDHSWIAQEAAALLYRNDIPFSRGKVLDYCRNFAQLCDAMTLPIVPRLNRREAVLLKVLYGIWNIVVDDELDRDGTSSGLDTSLAFLMATPVERGIFSKGACAILQKMAELVPEGRLARSDPIGFDLWEVAHGCCYEFFVSRNRSRATPFEYLRYSVMSASLKIFLDIDCLWGDCAPSWGTYRVLREGYDCLTSAMKLASDVGTLWREVHDENSMNYLRLLASTSAASNTWSAEQTMDSALRFRDDVTDMSCSYLSAARDSFTAVKEIDASGVLHSVASIVDVYLSGVDPFFEKTID